MKKFAAILSLSLFCMSPAFAAAEGKTTDAAPAAQVKADVKNEVKKLPAPEMSKPSKAQISKPIVEGEEKKHSSKAEATQAAKTVAKTAPLSASAKAPKVIQEAAITSGPMQNYVGEIGTYRARGDDTLLSIGERESLGYVELRSANPEMDPWRPGSGQFIILPKMHLLPDAPRKGIVINLSEMRVYYYPKNGPVATYPIGVGREGFSTPIGTTNIVSKTKDPTWRPTDRMLREDPTLKPVYGPGPDNPLGHYALYLGWPQYRMHGTNKPWGIGRRVSSGCIRMYDNDVQNLFNSVPVGTSVTTVRQPIKFAWIGDMLYIEAHPDEMLADQVERVGGAPLDYKVPGDLFADLQRVAGSSADNIDWKAVRAALRDRRGYPVPILQGASEKDLFVTASMIEKAGSGHSTELMTGEPTDGVPQAAPATPVAAQPAAATEEDAPVRPRNSRSSGFNG